MRNSVVHFAGTPKRCVGGFDSQQLVAADIWPAIFAFLQTGVASNAPEVWRWAFMTSACIVAALVCSLGAALPASAASGSKAQTLSEPFWKIRTRVVHTRPVRREGPLRPVNIADEEVREIENATRSIAPNAVVNIGSVITGCPCEEGPECTDQVWVVAYKPEYSRGLMLSRINSTWEVGPLQSWWLKHDEFYGVPKGALSIAARLSGQQQWTYLQELFEAFPSCSVGDNS